MVPSLDPPRPVQLPTAFQLISSTWGGRNGVNGVGEGSGVTLASLSPIRAILASHNVPSALSEDHTMSPGSQTAADQTRSRAGVWTGVKHPHPEEFLKNPHPCRATAAPSQALFLHCFPTGITPSRNPSCTSQTLFLLYFPSGISAFRNPSNCLQSL